MPDLGSVGVGGDGSSPRADEKLFARVRALLAKAESTDFAEEAEAFMAKAQELMTRHSLDRAILRGDAQNDASSATEARRCWLDDPYVRAKGLLLSIVAGANRCKAVSSFDLGFVTLIGDSDDLDVTEVLFTSLLVQAARQMSAASCCTVCPLPPASVPPVVPARLRQPDGILR